MDATLTLNRMSMEARETLRQLGLGGGRVVAIGPQGEKADSIFRVQDASLRDVEIPEPVAAALLKRINEQFGEPGAYRIDALYRGEGVGNADPPHRGAFPNDAEHIKALVAWEKARGFAPGQQR